MSTIKKLVEERKKLKQKLLKLTNKITAVETRKYLVEEELASLLEDREYVFEEELFFCDRNGKLRVKGKKPEMRSLPDG